MEIVTKYNTGDTVWLMYNNKVHEAEVNYIYVSLVKLFSDVQDQRVRYDLTLKTSCESSRKTIEESRLFPTKEDLIKSL